MVLSLSAKGLTHGEISAHLAEVYGADVSKTTISTITDKVMDGMAEWQNRPPSAPHRLGRPTADEPFGRPSLVAPLRRPVADQGGEAPSTALHGV
jgi:hypothetical protein